MSGVAELDTLRGRPRDTVNIDGSQPVTKFLSERRNEMDTPMNGKTATEVEISVWDRAHRTLDAIADDMRQRLNEIDHTQARLAGEADALRGVLNRIAPPPPQSINQANYAAQSAAPRTW